MKSKKPKLSKQDKFLKEVNLFKKELKVENIHIFNFIKDLKPVKTFKVFVKFARDRYELQLGEYCIVCSKKIHDLCDNQSVKYIVY